MSRSLYKDAIKSPSVVEKRITANINDRKKTFSRPFSKARVETTTSTPRMTSPSPTETAALLRQNQELRQRLQDEAGSYRRRIDSYKQAQSNQAALVSRLQTKVLQYKQRCNDLEGRIHDTIKPNCSVSKTSTACQSSIPLPPPTHSHTAPSSLPCSSLLEPSPPCREYAHHDEHDDICRTLEEEKNRCEQLISQNNLLRQQLEESNRSNEALTNDLQKLTNDWATLRDELVTKEDEFKEEEQAFNDYYHNEHDRLIKMWRDVVAVKRSFKDMQTFLRSDLGKMRIEITSVNREAQTACNGAVFSMKQLTRNEEAKQGQIERENSDLKTQIASLKSQYDCARHEINQRDLKLQELMQQLKTLEDRCGQAENQAMQANRLNDEIDRLNSALRDIAHAVVLDAEKSTDSDETAAIQHLHLSQSGMIAPPKSPRRGSTRTSQAFAEGTISAVQAVLHKYQLSIHDLQVKLQSNTEVLQATRKQLETSDNTKEILASNVSQLTEKLDSSNSQLSELFKERDSLQKMLDNIRGEKQHVERGRAELNSIVDNLSSDYEKLQNNNGKLQKYLDGLEEDKKALELEIQRILKDKDIVEMNLRAEEDRGSRLREETITLREELNKLYLTRDLLEQQRLESDSLITLLEKQKCELEFELDKMTMDRAELENRHEKLSSSSDNVTEEAKQLKDALHEAENERNKFKTQVIDQAADISSLKKELIAAEQIRLDLESDKLNLNEKQKFWEMEKEKVEQDLVHVTREKGDLLNQLTALNRKKETIGEELMRTRQRLEQANETNNRLNRSLEDLVKENEERQVIIEGHEKELQRMQELFASLRTEKESLEAVLFDTNTSLEATEERRAQLEREIQDLLVKEESLKNHVCRLSKELENCNKRAQEMKINLTNLAKEQEADFLQKIENLKSLSEENNRKLNEEKEIIRRSLESRMQQALRALQTAKDEEIEKLEEQLETLRAHLENLIEQHKETLCRAENEKQQALLMAAQDRQAIAKKLEDVSKALKRENECLERARREGAAKSEKDRNAINQLRDEFSKSKMKGEELKTQLEEEIKKLEIDLSSIKEERDGACRHIDELKMEIRLKEDKFDNINNQLQDALRKLKEAENCNDGNRKDLTDARRALAECDVERNKYEKSNKELRDHVKRTESAKREQSRVIEEALQKIASLEETRNNLDNEKTRLATLLKETENNLAKSNHDLNLAKTHLHKTQVDCTHKEATEKEMHGRISNEIEERERVQQELCHVKKQLADLEANLCATRQELARIRCQTDQEEHRWHSREQELVGRLDEGRNREKRLEDQKHNLEVCLSDATQQIQELKTRLGGYESRVRGLDEQLVCVEAHKKEAENKLSSIAHTLRRIAGVQFDGSVNLPYRLLSPSRRYSPVRGSCSHHDFDNRSMSGEGPVDVDPELVRKGVRTLMHQVAQIEREKEDYKMQLCNAKKQLQDAAEEHARFENKVSKLQQMLRICQEEKCNLESQLNTKVSSLQSVEETLKQKTDEAIALREKVTNLEMQLGSGIEEKGQCEDRLEKCRQHGARLEAEKRQLQDDLARLEGRASKLDLQRVGLEGDITRLTMQIAEKDNAIQALQVRLEDQSRTSAQLEDRCVSLKTTVEKQNETLKQAALAEEKLRWELNNLHKEKSEQGHFVQAGQDKMKQLEKILSSVENEKRILAERLDGSQNQVNELRRNQQAQQDSVQKLQEHLAQLEVDKSALESQLRIAKWSQENNEPSSLGQSNEGDLSRQLTNAQREKSELRSKLEALKDKVKQLENERHSKFSGHVQFDRSEKSMYGDGREMDSNRMECDSYMPRTGRQYSCGMDHAMIEQENRDLRMKVRRLESIIAEKEAELARAKMRMVENSKCMSGDTDRYRIAQVQAEKLLDGREQAHRLQIQRLENEISILRQQLSKDMKRRQKYISESSRANHEVRNLRSTIGDSLRHVSHDPLDQDLLQNEIRRLDTAVSISLPPSGCHDYDHSISPRKHI